MRQQLIYQFFSESILCVLLAFGIALLLTQASMSFFNNIADKQMALPWSSAVFWIVSAAFILITGLITGSYPAFYLSSFKPVKVLKGTFRVGRLASIPRKVLVVLQFTVSVVLIIGTIVVYRQIQYAKNRPVGYSRDGLVAVPMMTPEIHKHFDAVKSALLNTGTVSEIAESGAQPTESAGSTSAMDWPGKDPNLSVDFQQNNISYDYGKTIGWEFIEGRDFSRDFLSDSSAVIINQAAADYMNMKHPTQSYVKYYDKQFKIVGVTKDIIIGSPYEQALPVVYFLSKDPSSYVLLRINPKSSASEAIAKIGSVFKTYNPEQPFEYHFIDQEYAKKFGNEERYGKLGITFTSLAIFISCLGLFGMASFMAEQRIKEIGVRKVLGASVFNLWQLLSKDFAALVVISLIVASPLAWYFMHHWLQNYQYHTGIAWWIFLVTAMGAMLITMLTVSYQSIKAALANPVKSLKTE
jgi:ABC-type antimicrobial peptide transport system permease subunit